MICNSFFLKRQRAHVDSKVVKKTQELEEAFKVMRSYGMVLDKDIGSYKGMPLSFFLKVMLRNNSMPMHMFGEVYEELHHKVLSKKQVELLKV